ncbi:MAG: peptide deformylase [Lentisphaeraceae bacterium]|nr:peptide deformylase [Lentisphaeraceae bacterium]
MGLFTKQKKLEVQTYGNPVLRNDCAEIGAITPEITDLAERMVECMYDENGIGLAAPQIGENLRMFVIDTRVDEDEIYNTPGEAYLSPKMPLAIVNPEIVNSSGPDTPFVEGCLSIPGVNATVIRPEIIRLKGKLLNGEPIDIECGGLLSRCAQHEIDHLDGVLFTDKALEEEVVLAKAQLEKLTESNKKKPTNKKRRR